MKRKAQIEKNINDIISMRKMTKDDWGEGYLYGMREALEWIIDNEWTSDISEGLEKALNSKEEK